MRLEFAEPLHPSPLHAFARACAQSLGVIAGVVAFGLVWAAALAPAQPRAPTPAYTGGVALTASGAAAARELWLVDGYNVVQVALLGGASRDHWWGPDARGRLLDRLRNFDDPSAALWVAFDGPRPADAYVPDTAIRSVFRPSADDWLLAQLEAADDPSRVRLVTADRRLAARARHRGARVVTPGELLRRCGDATAQPTAS